MKTTQPSTDASKTIHGFRNFLRQVMRDGLDGRSWEIEFNEWLRWIENSIAAGTLRQDEAHVVWREEIPDAVSAQTCQGFVYSQPRGYAGDFEIIERIYQQWRSPNPALVKWDDYFHDQAAPQAVRNRKKYFVDWLVAKERILGGELRVLNIASGSARDVFDYFNANPESRVRIECVEQDPNAIAYSKILCAAFADRIQFYEGNALKFHSKQQYPLVWSAGFFDYLNDRLFVCALRRYWRMAEH